VGLELEELSLDGLLTLVGLLLELLSSDKELGLEIEVGLLLDELEELPLDGELTLVGLLELDDEDDELLSELGLETEVGLLLDEELDELSLEGLETEVGLLLDELELDDDVLSTTDCELGELGELIEDTLVGEDELDDSSTPPALANTRLRCRYIVQGTA